MMRAGVNSLRHCACLVAWALTAFLMLDEDLSTLHTFSSYAEAADSHVREPLYIQTDADRYAFDVELAQTPSERQKGLMYRQYLAPEHGMLFIFSRADKQSFWMRNTYISLDMLFIKADGRIANIIENTEPQTDTPRSSKGRVIAVLELAGGRAAELGIEAGDKVLSPSLGTFGN